MSHHLPKMVVTYYLNGTLFATLKDELPPAPGETITFYKEPDGPLGDPRSEFIMMPVCQRAVVASREWSNLDGRPVRCRIDLRPLKPA